MTSFRRNLGFAGLKTLFILSAEELTRFLLSTSTCDGRSVSRLAAPRYRTVSDESLCSPLFQTASGRLFNAGFVLVCCVGLPARGKTHVAHSIDRYLRWLGVSVRVFSLGDHRRTILGGADQLPSDYFATDGSRSPETEELRHRVKESFDATVESYFKKEEGQVAIYDANVSL